MKKTLTKILPLAIALAGAASNFAADEATKTAGATATARQVDESKLSPASVKVVRLLQAGMDEKVIVAYVKNNPTTKPVSAEELVYLHELGVTSRVLAAMLTPAKKTDTVQALVPVTTATETVEVTSNYTPIPGAPQPAQTQLNGSAVISTPVSAPAPVIVQQPAQPTVVYTQPTPVIVESAPPVYYDNRPTFSFGFGLGHFGHHGHGGHHSIIRHGHHGHGGHHGGRFGGHGRHH